MGLKEYRELLIQAKQQEPSEGHFIRCGMLASQLHEACWQPWAKSEASELSKEFLAERERSREAAGC